MNRENVIAELRKARAHIEGAIRACNVMKEQEKKSAAAYGIARSEAEEAAGRICEAVSALYRIEDTGTDLEELHLSVRAFNVLKRRGIDTIEQLTQKSPNEVIRIRGMGSRSYNEIVEALEARELSLRRY